MQIPVHTAPTCADVRARIIRKKLMSKSNFSEHIERNFSDYARELDPSDALENPGIGSHTENDEPPPPAEPAQAWLRRPRETPLAYSYFLAWLKSGVRRVGLPPTRQAPGAFVRDTFKLAYGTGANLASRWTWAARALEYDSRQAAPAAAAPGDPKQLRRQLRAQAMRVAQLTLADLETQLAAGERSATAGELSSLVQTIDRLTTVGDDEAAAAENKGPGPDYGKLDYAELKELKRLMRKAGGEIIVEMTTMPSKPGP